MSESAGEEREDQADQSTESNHGKPHNEETTPQQLDNEGNNGEEEEERRNDSSVDEGETEEGHMTQV